MKDIPLKNEFYFADDESGKTVRWDWSEDYQHAAWNHKTGKPKLKDLVLLDEHTPEEADSIKQELYMDILRNEYPNASELKEENERNNRHKRL